jgi:cyanophycinase
MSRLFVALAAIAAILLCSYASTASAQVEPYNETFAAEALHFAGAAYCTGPSVQSWTCSFCQEVKDVTTFGVVYNASTDMLGYVAYKNDTDSIVISFRGTSLLSILDWVEDLNFFEVAAICPGCEVHEGFLGAYLSIRDPLVKLVHEVTEQFPNSNVVLVGHSLGGALAYLASVDFILNEGIRTDYMYTFGQPRVSNSAFTDTWRALFHNTTSYRVTHGLDPVPHVPPRAFDFVHPPTEVYYDGLNTKHTICDGSGEDPTCADQWLLPLGVSDHITYLGIDFLAKWIACNGNKKAGVRPIVQGAEEEPLVIQPKQHVQHRSAAVTSFISSPDYDLYITGNATSDLPPAPRSPMAVLMGGGTDIAEAFQAQIAHAQGGDSSALVNVVIIRTAGDGAYNDWIQGLSSAVASVTTIVFHTRSGASDPVVLDIINGAGMLFIAGGDQATYVNLWTDTPMSEAITKARTMRNMPIGGTSAGLAVLGDVDNSALTGGIESTDALANPYDSGLTFNTTFIRGVPGLNHTITDTHFAIRERMGRLLAFLARMSTDVEPMDWTLARGVGVQQEGAVLVQEDPVTGHFIGTVVGVVGTSVAYFVQPQQAPTTIEAGLPLVWSNVLCTRVTVGGQFDMTTWTPLQSQMVSQYQLSVDQTGVITSSSGSVY